jgi:hypothetical protein
MVSTTNPDDVICVVYPLEAGGKVVITVDVLYG